MTIAVFAAVPAAMESPQDSVERLQLAVRLAVTSLSHEPSAAFPQCSSLGPVGLERVILGQGTYK